MFHLPSLSKKPTRRSRSSSAGRSSGPRSPGHLSAVRSKSPSFERSASKSPVGGQRPKVVESSRFQPRGERPSLDPRKSCPSLLRHPSPVLPHKLEKSRTVRHLGTLREESDSGIMVTCTLDLDDMIPVHDRLMTAKTVGIRLEPTKPKGEVAFTSLKSKLPTKAPLRVVPRRVLTRKGFGKVIANYDAFDMHGQRFLHQMSGILDRIKTKKTETYILEILLKDCHRLLLEPVGEGTPRDIMRSSSPSPLPHSDTTLEPPSLLWRAYFVYRPIDVVFDLDMTLVHCVEWTPEDFERSKVAVEGCGLEWKSFLRTLDGFSFRLKYEDGEESCFLGKVRDGAHDLLKQLHECKHIRLHICSMGTRRYVRNVLQMFPTDSFDNIWCREDLLTVAGPDGESSTRKHLFHLDDTFDRQSTVILDDSPDVWTRGDLQSVFRVQKFVYFPAVELFWKLDFSQLRNGRRSSGQYLEWIGDQLLGAVDKFVSDPVQSLRDFMEFVD
eukprot:TRINITY_DN1527_c0_g2_i1.p1 TRINITY_DN1527_c0_g2~~TRINITY_DN1527_c0_g2_i1.p1  ORF type:complete len:497 (-),score=102.72 TRINITY_DN1527_c0_g2_i1:1239-2729(-)